MLNIRPSGTSGGFVTDPRTSAPHIEVHSSRVWAFLHFKITDVLFRNTLAADDLGISLVKVKLWLTPWIRSDEHLPMSHIAEVTRERGLIWDKVIIESSGGLNPLTINGLPKSSAGAFVAYVRERMNQTSPTAAAPRK
jgi:hypothetical protein